MNSLFDKKKTIALLEIGKTYLKLALVEDNFDKSRLITKLVKEDLAGNEAIARILERESFDNLVIVLPRNQVTVRNLELPTTDPQEMKDIISIQAGKQTPFSKDEIITDFKIIGSNRPHYTKVLLAIVQKAIIKRYLDNLADKKDALQKIVLGSECYAGYFPVIRRRIEDETFAIFDFDEGFCDFCVYSRDKLLFTRLFSPKEIGDILDTYKKENIGPVFRKAVLMGANESISDMKNILAKELSLEGVGPFEEIEGVSFSEDAKAALDKAKKEGVSFSKLIGLALAPDRPLMDFLPQELKEIRRMRVKRKELMLTGILILSLFVFGGGIFLERIYAKTLLLKRLDARSVKLEKETSGLKKEDLKIKLIRKKIDTENSAIEVFLEVHKLTPQEIYLQCVTFEEGKSLSLRGTSQSMSEVFKFVKILQKLPVFKDVKTKYVTKRKLEGKDLTDFEITCLLGDSRIGAGG